MNENIIARVDAWLTGPGFSEDERRLELVGTWTALVGFWRREQGEAVKAAFAAALSGVLLALVRGAWEEIIPHTSNHGAEVEIMGECGIRWDSGFIPAGLEPLAALGEALAAALEAAP